MHVYANIRVYVFVYVGVYISCVLVYWYLCVPMCMCIYACEFVYVYVYLRRQQERDLMQKARLLTDEISVSFQMFLILLSSIALCSESQIPVFKEGQSNT